MILSNMSIALAGTVYGTALTQAYTNRAGSALTGNYGYNILQALATPRALNSYGSSADKGATILLGTGDTTPTSSDYALDTDVTDQFTYVSGISSGVGSGNVASITEVYQNTSNDSITIKEIGLLTGIPYQWQSGGYVLLTRKVLDTPIVIGAGKTYSFNITLSLNA